MKVTFYVYLSAPDMEGVDGLNYLQDHILPPLSSLGEPFRLLGVFSASEIFPALSWSSSETIPVASAYEDGVLQIELYFQAVKLQTVWRRIEFLQSAFLNFCDRTAVDCHFEYHID
ncbi:hypothetical protein [Riemerella anatipestifer]|uniref:hypothetical protein n=1 Tax=Riemerella anatipestifer TaxID=34085 RepID=UPI001374E68F|nr:hypothetical protein [Riemerella anatipestifer]